LLLRFDFRWGSIVVEVDDDVYNLKLSSYTAEIAYFFGAAMVSVNSSRR
jgi:hypothetical protein